MIIDVDAFLASLEWGEPPSYATPMLRAVWHGLRGNWDASHDLAQAQDDAEGAWAHAWLHRVEGDLSNAEYWYRRAHRSPRRDDTRAEGIDIARELIRSINGKSPESAQLAPVCQTVDAKKPIDPLVRR